MANFDYFYNDLALCNDSTDYTIIYYNAEELLPHNVCKNWNYVVPLLVFVCGKTKIFLNRCTVSKTLIILNFTRYYRHIFV